ncbi:alpha/beta fold hydrolase [Nocardia sp. NPDC004340]
MFVHGLLANGDLWRHVVPDLAALGYRCITPDWPLGSHTVPVPGLELTPATVATLIDEFLASLDLTDVTIVANDTGGALVQLLMVAHPERIGRVILTTCDAFTHFLPPPFHLLPQLFAVPAAPWMVSRFLSARLLHRTPLAFGWIAKRPLPPHIVESYVSHIRDDAEIRWDYRRFTRSISNTYTLDAAERLSEFTKPTLLVWGAQDKLFPLELAEKLHRRLPASTLRTLDDCYVFIAEDRPEALTAAILQFLRDPATNPSQP